MADATPDRYIAPGWFTRNVMNRVVRGLLRAGVSVWGARELRVRGRRSGEIRTAVVNVLDHDGDERFLVAPRGTAQWVRNLRAAGEGELRAGRRVERFRSVEVADADKVDVLRAYLRRWKFEIGKFFDGVGPDATDDDIAAIAAGYPVFRILPA
jgi:deazaflavin-dependent oxidoreductase (nitroreductase family)